MTPGEIADATGRIWIRAFSDDPRLGPIAFAKMDHGMVWVTEAQAVAAADYGWRRSIGWPHDQLVAIERTEAEANAILAEPAKA